METINNMANAAAKAVWGANENTTEEPVSGKTGDVSKGEPYDAGNMGNAASPHSGAASSSEPHKTKDSSTTSKDLSKAQQDVRSPDDPQTEQHHAEKRTNVDNTTGGRDTDDNPVKVDGPGPKPVEDLAKERGGDAGNVSSSSVDTEGKNADASGGKAPQADEDEDGPQKVSHGEGTGEQYVKSTGLNADGGDFDATKAGAGREADRLLEEKGIHKGASNKTSDSSDGKDPLEAKAERKSFGEKIKAKLHRNTMQH